MYKKSQKDGSISFLSIGIITNYLPPFVGILGDSDVIIEKLRLLFCVTATSV
jgi:hypothetical protein